MDRRGLHETDMTDKTERTDLTFVTASLLFKFFPKVLFLSTFEGYLLLRSTEYLLVIILLL